MTNEEKWISVEGYNHYEVSDTGRIRKISYLRTWVSPNVGYYQLQLFETDGCGKKRTGSGDKGKVKKVFLHRLIAQAFIPNPHNLPCVNHINGIKTDNRIENLEWCTYSENMSHAYKLGLRKPAGGRKSPQPNLSTPNT